MIIIVVGLSIVSNRAWGGKPVTISIPGIIVGGSDMTLKQFIDRSERTFMPILLFPSAPGITKSSGVLIVRKWLVSLMTLFIPGGNSLKLNFPS